MSGFLALALATRPDRLVDPFGYRSLETTWKPMAVAASDTAFETSSEKPSSADSTATVVGLGLSVSAMSSTPVRYLLAGDSTPKTYRWPCSKIASAAPLPSTIGTPSFSATTASLAVAAEPYGPRRNCARSALTSLSVTWAERSGRLSSSAYLSRTRCLAPPTAMPPWPLTHRSHRSYPCLASAPSLDWLPVSDIGTPMTMSCPLAEPPPSAPQAASPPAAAPTTAAAAGSARPRVLHMDLPSHPRPGRGPTADAGAPPGERAGATPQPTATVGQIGRAH